MLLLRWLPVVTWIACVVSCSTHSTRVVTAEAAQSCQLHKVKMVNRWMGECEVPGAEGSADIGIQSYYKAHQASFPNTGLVLPGDCGPSQPRQLWLCQECIKKEKVWIRSHPQRLHPDYGTPDPRL